MHFGNNYGLRSFLVLCYKLCTSALFFFFCFFFIAVLLFRLSQGMSGWLGTIGGQPFIGFSKDVWLAQSPGSGWATRGHSWVVSKSLLYCLGFVCRVIVMLEGELSARSEVLSALNQVFIKDISIFNCIHLYVFSDHFPSPSAEKHPHCMMLPPPCFVVRVVLFRW